jgi:long-chain acyl-CoA synthetase
MGETIYQSFAETVARHPNRTALMYKVRGQYVGITYKELSGLVDSVAAHIQQLGIRKGDAVGIFSCNRPEWAIADLAALKLGGVVVPIYPTLSAPYVEYILRDSGMRLIFVENAERFSLIDAVRGEVPDLANVVIFADSGVGSEKSFLSLDDMKGQESSLIGEEAAISSNDVATVVYTSGTTGEPKGVVLTHRNILTNAFSVSERFQVSCEEVFLSYLPLAHMFERTCGYYAMLFAGASIAYAEGMSTLAEDVARVRPTLLVAVPRLLEKAYGQAMEEIEGGSWFRRFLVSSAIRSLNTYANLMYRKMKIPLVLALKCRMYNRFVASKFRNIAGGRVRILASGAAPLDRELAKICHILGFNIVEGYGLTETSPIVCCHTLNDKRLGTVGTPLDGVEVKIGENDEILVRGPNVMREYLNKPEETASVIDNDGWLHTGDQGRFDEQGNLIISGRIKEIIVTSYGKKIAPVPIESRLAKGKYISQAVLYGEGRNYIVALIVPDRKAIEAHAGAADIRFDDYPALLEHDEIRETISCEVEALTGDLAAYEKIREFTLISEEFTEANGLLTPSQKIRRTKINRFNVREAREGGAEMRGELFLTGATGYIGSSILQKWLDSTDVRLNLLVRRRHEEGPEDRLDRVLAGVYGDGEISRFSERIEVIEGDVSLDRFGLSPSEYARLAGRISHIVHCAAAARFDLELQDARKTNVMGTVNVLDFARNCQLLEKIDYIGTAYVAGKRKGIVKEDELDEGQEHNNTYERTKFEAEKLVRDIMSELPITILRPSIVVCDSRTGRASRYNGFYRAMRMYSLGLLKMLPGHPSSLIDLVPVDYITDTTYSIARSMDSIGKCYQLTAGRDNGTRIEEIRDLASSHFGREKLVLIAPEEFPVYVSRMEHRLSEDERGVIDEIRLYMPYLTSELRFDNSHTVAETGLEPPGISSYFGKMAEYIMKHNTGR